MVRAFTWEREDLNLNPASELGFEPESLPSQERSLNHKAVGYSGVDLSPSLPLKLFHVVKTTLIAIGSDRVGKNNSVA